MVINHLKIQCNAAKDIVIYAYCKGLDPKSQTSPVQMMSALLKQLCSNLQTLPDAVLKLYRDFRMNARRPSFDNIKDLFLQSTRLFGRIFVVLDGLDECEEKYRKPIMQFVCEISNQSGNTKAFVASRRELDILRTFSRHGVYHVESISPSALDDMKKLIKHRVTTDLSHVDLDIQQDIIKKLIDNSKGM